MTGWGETADIAMEKGEGNSWFGMATLTPEDAWKVRADADWNVGNWNDIGSDNLTLDGDGNIHVAEAGIYKITISFDGGVKITAEKQ
jgi:hypothetical protein